MNENPLTTLTVQHIANQFDTLADTIPKFKDCLRDRFNCYSDHIITVKLQLKLLHYDYDLFLELIKQPKLTTQGKIMTEFGEAKIKKFLRGDRWKNWHQLHVMAEEYLIEHGRLSRKGR